jgi:hypothetical protein
MSTNIIGSVLLTYWVLWPRHIMFRFKMFCSNWKSSSSELDSSDFIFYGMVWVNLYLAFLSHHHAHHHHVHCVRMELLHVLRLQHLLEHRIIEMRVCIILPTGRVCA